MDIFVEQADWNNHYESLEQFFSDQTEEYDDIEGMEFQLLRVAVSVATTYRIIEGKPVAISVAFPTGVE